MAILSKIRDRSVFLIVVVGLALFAFVLDPSTLSDFFNSSKVNEVGEVNGESISRQKYAEALEIYRARSGGRTSEMQASNVVWDNLLREKIYSQQLEKAGITIGENDVWQKLITMPSVTSSPRFQNEAGMFSEDALKQYLKDAQENDVETYRAWTNYMSQIKLDILKETYDNLVNSGIRASLKEGEVRHIEENKTVDADYIFVNYNTIADSLVSVTEADIEKYVKDHSKKFTVEETRDISYVLFDVKPTEADKDAIKSEVNSLLEDRKEFNNVSKQEEVIAGLKNASDYQLFFDENKSDLPLDENFKIKNQITALIAEGVLNGNVNDVVGPYEDNNMFKISKIVEIAQMPDSVKSSHILIPFAGAARSTSTKTEEEAKKEADSILSIVRNNKKKFTSIADEINTDGTKGKGGDIGWISFSQGFSAGFDKSYAEFIFNNKKGKVGVVKSNFGYHVIRIDDLKNIQKAVKLVTFGRNIVASEETETNIFQEAESFALEISKDREKYYSIAKENNLVSKPAVGLKKLDEFVPGLGMNREMVVWSFGEDSKVGEYKRFDLNEGGHVVAIVTAVGEEGLMTAVKASPRVKPILIKEKKAELIKEKLEGANLADIASANNVQVSKANGVTIKTPTISGVGSEPKVIGAMYNAEIGKLVRGVEGNRGVFAFVVNNVKEASELPNYDSYRNTISSERKNSSFKIFSALKEASEVEDYRATFYGVSQ